MIQKIGQGLLAATVFTVLSTPIYAEDHNFYLGASIGSAKANDACDDLDEVSFIGSCDERDTAGKLFAGYQFTSLWGVEAFYADFGETSAKGTINGDSAKAEFDADGFGLAATATWDINEQFSIFGKFGVIRWDVDGKASIENLSATDDDDGTDILFGAGAGYSFTENIAIRAEWERFNDVSDTDIDLFSAGIVYSF